MKGARFVLLSNLLSKVVRFHTTRFSFSLSPFSSGRKLLSKRVDLGVAVWTNGTVGGHPASTLKASGLMAARYEDGISLVLLTTAANPSHDGRESTLVDLAKLLHGACSWKLGISLQRRDPVCKSSWRHHSRSFR